MSNRNSKLWRERITASNRQKKTTHGATPAGRVRPPEYEAWRNMRKRCYLKTDHNYDKYGGRGITVCERWQGKSGFANFLADVGPRPSDKHSLGRIDNDGNYEPENCRWETATQQSRNRRSNVRFEFGGESLTIPEIGERVGIATHVLQLRITRMGWSVERATTTPVESRRGRLKIDRDRVVALVRLTPLAIETAVKTGESFEKALVSFGQAIGVTSEEAEQLAMRSPEELVEYLRAATVPIS